MQKEFVCPTERRVFQQYAKVDRELIENVTYSR